MGINVNEDIGYAAEKVSRYLDKNSLARNVIMADFMSPGDIPRYEPGEGDTLDDISLIIKQSGEVMVVSAKEAETPEKDDSFYMPTWEFASNYMDTGTQGVMTDELLEQIKKDALDNEENIFMDLVKQVTEKNGRYIFCNNVDDALKEVEKIDYAKIWKGKDIEADVPDLQDISSANLNGFILAKSSESEVRGVCCLRQDLTILPYHDKDAFVAYEEQAMLLVNDELTYIEVKKKNEILMLDKADSFIHSFLRKVNKSVDEYDSTEEVIKDFLKYYEELTLEDKE